jgi:pyridoxamine 5'-phosphate oxidase
MDLTPQLQQLRREYQQAELDGEQLLKDPIAQCELWIDQAIQTQMPDPTAMVLATANHEAQPSTRVVLLKGITDKQLIFYSHYDSHKGLDIDHNPFVAVNFFWPLLERQILIQGDIHRQKSEQSDAYFSQRPRDSQISAWASKQSQVIPSRAALAQQYQTYEKQFANQVIPRPENWGGYAITPFYIEFWQGREQRLHDRIAYELIGDFWQISRLSP